MREQYLLRIFDRRKLYEGLPVVRSNIRALVTEEAVPKKR